MSDEQRRVVLFQAQPAGQGPFLCPSALSFAHIAGLHHAHSALLDTKTVPAGRIGFVLAGPSQVINTSGLSLEQAPPLFVPFKFFFSAALFSVAIGLLLIFNGQDLYSSRWSPLALTLTHLVTVGFLAQVMTGAMFQLLPVVVGTPLPSVMLVSSIVNLCLALGAISLSSGFLFFNHELLMLGAVLISVGFSVFLVAASLTIKGKSVPIKITLQLGLGWFSVIPTALLGILLVLALAGKVALNDMQHVITVHLSWGLMGWLGIVLFSVLFKLVPIFYVTREIPLLLQQIYAPSIVILLTFFTLSIFIEDPVFKSSITAVLFLLCLMAVGILVIIIQRKRPIIDSTLLFIGTGIGCLLLAAAIWIVSERDVVIGILLLIGVGLTIPIGIIYRVLPFLCWYHLQAVVLKRRRFNAQIPSMKHFIPERSARRHYIVHTSAIILLLAGDFITQPFPALPGIVFTGSAIYLSSNIAKAYMAYQRAIQVHF
ncbi:MAG: hypothetical protein N0E44_08430 [Candidatus Thiodiazotropha lotti]|nr:hypothetical protein [Candidatus Thiodiazotropha lotti]MCW4219905.1 hypothetical protein [Candidatus Thiodiazotropha lotti]